MQFRDLSKKRQSSLSLLRLFSQPEELQQLFPLLMLILESTSSPLTQFNSRLMSTKLLYKPFRAYSRSNSRKSWRLNSENRESIKSNSKQGHKSNSKRKSESKRMNSKG